MSMPALFKGRLSIPVIGAPLFIISVPDLVIAQPVRPCLFARDLYGSKVIPLVRKLMTQGSYPMPERLT